MKKFELIITIVNKDYATSLMEAAREVGAKGGTILNARGTGDHSVEKLFGLTIQQEKEVVLKWQEARKNKDFETADMLRNKINELGIRL